MQNNTYPSHVKEFTGKYEDQNPIARKLVDGFYRGLSELIPSDISSVLEAGCGAGFSAERIIPLLPAGATYEGSDIGEDLITIAKEKLPGILFSTESIYELQRPDNSFDCVMALETLEHLDDPLKALQELKRVSRKYVIISVPREPLWRVLNMARLKYVDSLGNTPGHLNHWSTRSLQKFVEQEIPAVKYRTPLPWSMVLARVDT